MHRLAITRVKRGTETMDKANANFDAENATKDGYGNIMAKNQNGVTAEIVGGDKNGLVVNIKLIEAGEKNS